jgi:hypothetical protein
METSLKERVLVRVKEMLEAEGKQHLMEFAEEIAGVIYKVLVIIVEETETKLDDMVLSSMEDMIKKAIDGIDGTEG